MAAIARRAVTTNPGGDHGRLERQDGLRSALQQLSGELRRLGLQLAASVTLIWLEACAFEHSIRELVRTLATRRRPRNGSGSLRWEHRVRQAIWSLPARLAHRMLRIARGWRRAASGWDLRVSPRTAG